LTLKHIDAITVIRPPGDNREVLCFYRWTAYAT